MLEFIIAQFLDSFAAATSPPPPPPRLPPAPPLPIAAIAASAADARAAAAARAAAVARAAAAVAPGGQLELNQIMEKMDEAARLHDEVSTRGRAASALAALSFLFLSFWSPFFQIPMALALFALVYFWYWRKDPNFEELLAQAKQKAQAGLVGRQELAAGGDAVRLVRLGAAAVRALEEPVHAVDALVAPPHLRRRDGDPLPAVVDDAPRLPPGDRPPRAPLRHALAAHRGARHRAARRRRRRGAARASLPASALTAGVVLLQPTTANATANATAIATNATAAGAAEAAAPAPEATPLPPGAPAGAMMLVRLRDAVLQAAKFQKWPKAKLWQPPNPKQPPKAPAPPKTGRT